MKKLIVFTAFIALAGVARSDRFKDYPGELRGTIVQIATGDGGILVNGAFKTDELDNSRQPVFLTGIFFLKGFRGNAVDGDSVKVKAYRDGKYTYKTALGSVATVTALKYSDD